MVAAATGAFVGGAAAGATRYVGEQVGTFEWYDDFESQLPELERVLPIGDFDADGYADFGVRRGLPFHSVDVHFGGPAGSAARELQITASSTSFYPIVIGGTAEAGDLNGDGYSDVVLGTAYRDAPGEFRLFLGGPAPDSVADLTRESPSGAVCIPGDINADGYDDIVAIEGPALGETTDRLRILFGAPSPSEFVEQHVTLPGLYPSAVHSAGDMNADGIADFVIYDAAPQNLRSTRALLFFGGAPFDTVYDAALVAITFSALLSGHDVTGDGVDDLIVSRKLWIGSPMLSGETFGLSIVPPSDLADVDGDGHDDGVIYRTTFVSNVYLVSTWRVSMSVTFGPTFADTVAFASPTMRCQSGYPCTQELRWVGDTDGDGRPNLATRLEDIALWAPRSFEFVYPARDTTWRTGSTPSVAWTGDARVQLTLVSLDSPNTFGVTTTLGSEGPHVATFAVPASLVGSAVLVASPADTSVHWTLQAPGAITVQPGWCQGLVGTVSRDFPGYTGRGDATAAAPHALALGDINADGRDDLGVLGAYDGVRVYFGGDSLGAEPDLTLSPPVEDSQSHTAAAVRWNTDEYADIAITSATGYSDPRTRVSVYFGGPGMDAVADTEWTTDLGIASVGMYGNGPFISSPGDIDSDGREDLLVSLPYSVTFVGEPAPLSGTVAYFGGGATSPLVVSGQLGGAGDMNGDGIVDLIHITATTQLLLSGSGLDTLGDATLDRNVGYAESVIRGHDLNHDGFDDLLVQATDSTTYVWYGRSAFSSAVWADVLPYRVMSVLDVNGDGFEDVITAENSICSLYASTSELSVRWGPDFTEHQHFVTTPYIEGITAVGDVQGGPCPEYAAFAGCYSYEVSLITTQTFTNVQPSGVVIWSPSSIQHITWYGETKAAVWFDPLDGSAPVFVVGNVGGALENDVTITTPRVACGAATIRVQANDPLFEEAAAGAVAVTDTALAVPTFVVHAGPITGRRIEWSTPLSMDLIQGFRVSWYGGVGSPILRETTFDDTTGSATRAYQLYAVWANGVSTLLRQGTSAPFHVTRLAEPSPWPVGAFRRIEWIGGDFVDIVVRTSDPIGEWSLALHAGGLDTNSVTVQLPRLLREDATLVFLMDGRETLSLPIRAQTRSSLLSFTASPATPGLRLQWHTSPTLVDIAGYRVERAVQGSSLYVTIADTLRDTVFVDAGGGPDDVYRLSLIDGLGGVSTIGTWTPNGDPFSAGAVRIWFMVLEGSGTPVSIDIFDVRGRHRRRLVDGGTFAPGRWSVAWNRTDDRGAAVESGAYFVRLVLGSTNEQRRIVLTR